MKVDKGKVTEGANLVCSSSLPLLISTSSGDVEETLLDFNIILKADEQQYHIK